MDPYVGEIRLFAGNYAPSGWAFCEGQELSIQQNAALYSIIGITYGGDGKTLFKLPDLRGLAPMHQGTGAGLTPRMLGETGGESTVTLNEVQMPNHNHVPNAQTTADTESPVGAVWAETPHAGRRPGPNAYSAAETLPMSPLVFNNAGGGQPHNNMQPYLTLNFIIALEGVYPVKSS